ncbi:MAG: hypothetical protein KJS97_13410 [Alphaproteobacteria bacterium]|nr:hypothetical protein [Alphaproteobacteria bacterium]
MTLGVADRRSARPFDVLLRAFLKARGWRGGRRGLLDALPEGGRLETADDFATVLDRIGLRCRWRWTFVGLLTAGDLPALAMTRGGPLLLTRIGVDGVVLARNPEALRDERAAPTRTPMRVLVVEAADDRCRSSVHGAMLGVGDAIARAGALTLPVVAFAGAAPWLARDAAAGGFVAGACLAGLAAAAFGARWIRDGVLAHAAVRLEHRLASLAAERALHHPAPDPTDNAAVDRFGGLPASVTRGVAGAAFDAVAVVAACLGTLAIGGSGAIAPLFAALALAVLLLATRERGMALAAVAEPGVAVSPGLAAFRRADHSVLVTAAAQAIVGVAAAAAVAAWASSGRGLADLAGHVTGLLLAAAPLMVLARESATLCDAMRAFEAAHALERAPEERRRLTRLALKTPAALTFRDVAASAPSEAADADEDTGAVLIRVPALTIAGGDVVALTGPRDGGARTLLAAVAGLTPLDEGAILVGGRDLRRVDAIAYRAEIGVVGRRLVAPQGATALELVRRLAPFAEDTAAVAAFERVGLAALGVTPSTTLDEIALAADDPAIAPLRLRLSMAGALARRPPLLLLDLDDAALAADPAGETLVAEIAAALRGRTTILMATTRPALLRQADVEIEIARGRVRAVGAPAVVATPSPDATRFSAFGRA